MPSTNTHTSIIGVFNDHHQAEQAERELVSNGIPQDAVHLQSNNKTVSAGSMNYRNDEGTIRGFFHRIFGGDEEKNTDTERYSDVLNQGRTVLAVDATEGQIDQAVAILNQYGAVDIDEAELDDGRGTEARTAGRQQWSEPQWGQSIPVVDEQIKIGKRSVRRGGVRVYSHIVDQPVEQRITLRGERVRVERRPVDRTASEAELSGLRDQSFEVTETVEEPVVEKVLRVKEEVIVGKETTEKEQTVHETVRHSDVRVEQLGTEGANNDYEQDFRADWNRNYVSAGGDYMAYAPSYQYGYQSASDPRYRGRSWSEAEPDLRKQYEAKYPGSGWEKMKNAVRYGWEKVTGR
jgi:uncharacterized protein (TIGR02271 family)